MPLTKIDTKMMGSGAVLQVVSASLGTSNVTTSSSSYSDVLVATITPSSTNSKILVLANGWAGCTRVGDQLYVTGKIERRLSGVDTQITVGNNMTSGAHANHYRYTPGVATSVITYRMVFNHLDSPNTLLPVSYVWKHAAIGSVDTNQTSGVEIQLIEIAG